MNTLKTQQVDLIKSAEQPTEGVISSYELEDLRKSAAKTLELEANLQASKDQVTDLQKAVQEKEALELELADLRKAAEELADLKKAAADQMFDETREVVKGFNLFEDDKVEDLTKFFVKNAGEESKLILVALEKARKSVEAFGTEEIGTDLEGVTEDLEKSEKSLSDLSQEVKSIINQRKSK